MLCGIFVKYNFSSPRPRDLPDESHMDEIAVARRGLGEIVVLYCIIFLCVLGVSIERCYTLILL